MLLVSPPHTRCEREKAENGRKQLVLPETFVPRCNVYNGLYADVQYMPSGWKWCVDKFNGERVGSTDTEPGPQEPLCPGEEYISVVTNNCPITVHTSMFNHSIVDRYLSSLCTSTTWKYYQINV